MSEATIPVVLRKDEWRVIDEFPNYEINTCGVVRRRVADSNGRFKDHILVARKRGPYQYLSIGLRDADGKRFYRIISNLVCRAFHGDPPSPIHQAAHIDGQKYNNHKDNLAWKTPTENMADQLLHGTRIHGELHYASKLSDEQVLTIKHLLSIDTKRGRLRRIAQMFGVCKQTVHNIHTGRDRSPISCEKIQHL